MIHLLRTLDAPTAACGAPLGATAVLHPALATCQACLRGGLATAMPEATLLEAVRNLASRYGFLCYHTHRSDRSEPGWFDLALAKPGHPLHLAELKSAHGKLTLQQRQWAETVMHTTGTPQVHLWRPGDLIAIADMLGGHR